MVAILTENPVDIRPDEPIVVLNSEDVIDIEEKVTELGIWLSGLRSYLASRPRMLQGTDATPWQQLAATEFKVVHAGIKHCVVLSSFILSDKEGVAELSAFGNGSLSASGLVALHELLNEAVLVSESFINSSVQGPGQWRAWSAMLSRRIEETPAFYEVVHIAEIAGTRYLPARLRAIAADTGSLTPEIAELVLVLPRFGMVLKWLSIVKKNA